jgi:hypothetical protein
MVCVFNVSEDVVNVATPLVVIPVPIAVVPSKKVTSSPSGIVPWLGITVAVKVTGFPTNEGDPEVINTVLVGTPLLTCSTSAEDTLPILFVSPEYVAVIVWVAGVVYFVVYAAWLPTIATVATVEPPSWNITVPVTVPPY